MRGFLDPDFPRTPTDYRSVLDGLLAVLGPSEGFSFGTEIRPIPPTLATATGLANREFYTDKNTDVEAVLARIAADTLLTRTHIVIGDGRRGAPATALAQFVRMREVAVAWTRAGGTFLAGVTMAPFTPVPSDPSGCRSETAATGPSVCPLYAFAFLPPRKGSAAARAIATLFEHHYAWPLGSPGAARLELAPAGPVSGINYVRRWAWSADSVPIGRFTSSRPATQWLPLVPALRDSSDVTVRTVGAFVNGQRLRPEIRVRALQNGSAASAWGPVGANAPVRVDSVGGRDGQRSAVAVITGRTTATKGLYRVDFVPSGEPSWLGQFDASDATDRQRTYGLGRLFETFRSDAASASADSLSVARFILVVN
jgi:hypothetical protein